MSLIHHIVLYVALVAIINVFNTPYSLVCSTGGYYPCL